MATGADGSQEYLSYGMGKAMSGACLASSSRALRSVLIDKVG